LLTILILTAAAVAQQGTKNLSEASLEELTNIQVYSASKHMQSVSDAPSSVTVVTADEIQKYGYRTLADILRSVRGFYVTDDRNYSFVGVRGFGRLGDWNSRVLLLIDGHRANNIILGQAMIGSEFPVDVDLIERIEIVRGPSSSLYGDGAFFAVINVITRSGSHMKGWELTFAPASFGSYTGRASYGGQYKGMGIVLSGTLHDSQGQTLFFPEFESPTTNNGITSDTDYENSQHFLATITFRGFTLQGLFSRRDKGTPNAYFGSLFNDSRTHNVDDYQYFDLSYQHFLTEKWELLARTSYDQARLEGPVAYATGVENFSFRANWWTGNVQLSRTFLEKHKLTFGSEVRDNLRQDQGDFISADNIFTADKGSSFIWALFGQGEFSITQPLTLSAGVRYDHYSNFGQTTNPRFGLIYHPFHPTTFKLLYGSAFRAPEPFESTPDFAFCEDNLQLKPERIKSVEGVVEQSLGQHFKLSGNVYRNWINYLISAETDSTNGLLVYRNLANVNARGVEVELDGRFVGGLEGKASYGFSETGDALTGQSLSNSARHLGKLNLIAPLPRNLFASLDAQYNSSRQTLAGNTVSGFAVFNLTVLGHTLGKHMDLSASIYNILDKKYSDPGRPEDPEDSIPQDGRSFRIKITSRF
jgi:iron complex outermembrane receptor protein